jgi:hypothetical protein
MPTGEIDTDDRLGTLERHAVKTESRLDGIERTQVDHGVKLERIVTAVTQFDSRPKFDVHKILSSVRDLVVVASVFSTLAVWFVLTLTASNDKAVELSIKHEAERVELRLAAFRERLAWIESGIKWTAQIEHIKPN